MEDELERDWGDEKHVESSRGVHHGMLPKNDRINSRHTTSRDTVSAIKIVCKTGFQNLEIIIKCILSGLVIYGIHFLHI